MRIVLLIALIAPLCAAAEERILQFHSDIVVNPDGWVEVTETIAVRAEGARIVRGIYRDFPTRYVDRHGNIFEVRYEPLAVLRDGEQENFFSERYQNGVRTYFGRSNVHLEPGMHTYAFRYRASRMLGFFADYDELYWNVTGLNWAFPIDAASATVSLNFVAAPDILEADAYTGPMGATGKDFRIDTSTSGTARFETSRVLGSAEGLTIVVTWPKGFVTEPGSLQRAAWLFADNLNLAVALVGLIAMLGYFIPVWRQHGADPEVGLLVTRYEPPDGFSPASLRYIQQMYYDSKVMTAAVVNLAVKGYLRINNKNDLHTLKKTDPDSNAPALATGEQELYDALFRKGSTVILDDKYHALIGGARKAHRKSLQRDFAGRYFRVNGALSIPGLLIGFIAVLIALNIEPGPTPMVIVTIVIMVLAALFFVSIMRRPTVLGRKLLDEVLGFRDYLEIAEKDELNLRNPPEKTPQLFEAYLPFALAMGVEQAWSERFSSVFARLRGANDTAYHPSWYNGSWNSINISDNTSGLMSGLNSAISSSATPPGSSSGGGGGGSSGGGGGGGGGGGW